MPPAIRAISVAALVLLLFPVITELSGWHWQPVGNSPWLGIQLFITDSAGFPWAVGTCFLISILLVWQLRLNVAYGFFLVGLCLTAIMIGQGVKSAFKNIAQESRPYVVWLEQRYAIPPESFYEMPRTERAELIQKTVAEEPLIPEPLREHWQSETGYSFPSGHTMFSATWALLGVGVLWPRQKYFLSGVLVLWAVAAAGSRMILGMHWPMDLIVSTLIGWGIVVIALSAGKRFLYSAGDDKKQGCV
ncbi:MAG: phosphatidylglycerophosphatase B [Puniceicoccales bacterium]|jgi:phosphatidylglycerophosphatase B|nr:phosphatidylglycerophosphatase B [Puniceicoccales bacterium]